MTGIELLLRRSESSDEARLARYASVAKESTHWIQFQCFGPQRIEGMFHIVPDVLLTSVPTGDECMEPAVGAITEKLAVHTGLEHDDFLYKLTRNIGVENYEKNDGLVNQMRQLSVRKLKPARVRQVREIAHSLAQTTQTYHGLLNALESKDSPEDESARSQNPMKGEEVFCYLLMEQGVLFPSTFYEDLASGLFADRCIRAFPNPKGILKSVLERRGYVPYLRQQQPLCIYLPSGVPAEQLPKYVRTEQK